MRTLISLWMCAALSLVPMTALAQPAPLPIDDEAAAFRQLAAGIPLGTRVTVRTREGRRFTATLVAVESDRIIVQRASRVPEPPLGLPFERIARLEREHKGGFSLGKALGIGVGAGVGAILTIFAIAVSIND